ncbi:MAG TPA: aspartate dehydrogenase domain-containing protein [Kofleriaceae bacterium]|nr:aspartate dehydrogenase domain-containing protein [Kofleriaceae bacterium]
MATRPVRVGLIGFGFIGKGVYRAIVERELGGLEVAFVWNRSADKLAGVPAERVVADLASFARTAPDLILESAHPDITRAHGEALVACCDYMPFSVTALADSALHQRVMAAATAHGHRLVLPQGALVGTDALLGWRHMWRDVTITFRKHPGNIDLTAVNLRADEIRGETVVFDGPVRDIAPLFPRNVNTMVTCALATIGVDRCRGRMIADPALDHAVAEVEAWGKDGSHLQIVKHQPMVGVSGTEMLASALRSLQKATGTGPALDFL